MYVPKSGACEYCGTQRSQNSHNLVEDDYEDLLAFRNSDRFTEQQKAALEWTDTICGDPGSADDELCEQLHANFTGR